MDKDPDDQIMRDNLARAQANLTNERGLEAYNKGDFAGAVALFQEAVDIHPVNGHPLDQTAIEVLRRSLAAAQAELANAYAKLQADAAERANAQAKLESERLVSPAPVPPSSDPVVVDTRKVPSGLPKPVEDAIAGAYRDAPPGVSDRVRKGSRRSRPTIGMSPRRGSKTHSTWTPTMPA